MSLEQRETDLFRNTLQDKETKMNDIIAINSTALVQINERLDRLETLLKTMKFTPEPKWITIPEYARRIGKSENTVHRHIREGLLQVGGIPGSARLVLNPDA